MQKMFINFILSVLVLAGVGIAVYGTGTVIEAYESTDWPQTDGSVAASGVDMKSDATDGRTRALRYSPAVSYGYDVDGRTYFSDRLGFTRVWTGEESDAQAIVRRYPVGQAVTVYYDPDDPLRAVLTPGVSLNSTLGLLFGLGWIAIMTVAMYVFNRFFAHRLSG